MFIKKAISKYNSLSNPVKASIWFAICNILQKGISLLSTPIFTRIMTTEQYGMYTVYNSWYSIIIILGTLNLSAGVYNNAITHYPEDRSLITSSFQGLSTVITLILFLVYLAGIKFWSGVLELQPLLVIIMFAEIVFVPSFQFWTVGQQYDFKYKINSLISLIIALSSPILGIATVLSTDYKAEARIISYALVQIMVGAVFYAYNLKKGKAFFNKKYWKYALAFNLPLIPHYLSMTVLSQSDRIMISRMVGDSEAAYYSVAYTVAMLMTIITTAINSSFVPYTYRALKEKNYVGLKRSTNFLLFLVSILCILTMAFGPEVIKVFAAEDYYDAVWVIPPVASSVYFVFLYPLFSNIEFYFNKTKYVMFASAIGSMANIVLNYFCIKIWGYYAAGYTTLVCYILFSIGHYILYKFIIRKACIEVTNIYDQKFIFACSVILIISMVGMTLIYKYTILRYAIIIIIIMLLILFRKKIKGKLKEILKGEGQ